jgi:hypothetical protein
MKRKKHREVTGVLRFMPELSGLGRPHFVVTKEGTLWRLEVEPDRVYWLDGLLVRVGGMEENGVIAVSSIVRA